MKKYEKSTREYSFPILKMSKAKKYYLIIAKKNKWSYGAFPHTEEGLKEAKKYLRTIQKKNDDQLEIIEK